MTNSLLIKVKLFAPHLWQQTVRHRVKFNPKMPHPRHDIARHLEEITKPIIVKERPDPIEKCLANKSIVFKALKITTNEAVDYERFLAKHALNLMKTHEVMLILNKLDCPGETYRRSMIEFKKNESLIWNFNTITMKLLIENNPKYQNLYPIVSTGVGRNYYLFLQEKNLKKTFSTMRKMSHFVLLGGMINECLYTRNGILNYMKLENIDDARAQLVACLNQQLAQVPNTLSTPINNLSHSLTQHSKPSTSDDEKSS